jgi:hypothetical protein
MASPGFQAPAALVAIPDTRDLGDILAIVALPVKMVRMGLGDPADFVAAPAK